MAQTMIRRLTARDARLSSFRYYDLLVHVFVVVLLISNLVEQKICAIPLFRFPRACDHGEDFRRAGLSRSPTSSATSSRKCSLATALAARIWLGLRRLRTGAFETVFYVPRFIVKVGAFWLGEFTNSHTLAKMKLWSDGKWLWTRTVGSTSPDNS